MSAIITKLLVWGIKLWAEANKNSLYIIGLAV